MSIRQRSESDSQTPAVKSLTAERWAVDRRSGSRANPSRTEESIMSTPSEPLGASTDDEDDVDDEDVFYEVAPFPRGMKSHAQREDPSSSDSRAAEDNGPTDPQGIVTQAPWRS